MKFGVCILVGGKSTRMKKTKADLMYRGKTFLSILCDEFKDFDYKYISMHDQQKYEIDGYINVVDEYKEIGPMGGIVSTFHQSDVDVLFVCSCDMPFINKEVVLYLMQKLENEDGIFLKDENHVYITSGIYTRKLLPVFENQIRNRDYRLYYSIRNQNIKTIDIHKTNIDAKVVLNINTDDQYEDLKL